MLRIIAAMAILGWHCAAGMALEPKTTVRVYNVADLVTRDAVIEQASSIQAVFQELATAVSLVVSDTGNSVRMYSPTLSLIACATDEQHAGITSLLKELREPPEIELDFQVLQAVPDRPDTDTPELQRLAEALIVPHLQGRLVAVDPQDWESLVAAVGGTVAPAPAVRLRSGIRQTLGAGGFMVGFLTVAVSPGTDEVHLRIELPTEIASSGLPKNTSGTLAMGDSMVVGLHNPNDEQSETHFALVTIRHPAPKAAKPASALDAIQ